MRMPGSASLSLPVVQTPPLKWEFVATTEGGNLEDKLAYLNEQPEIQDEREFSFRLLRHYASSVQHRKYHGIDIITVQVAPSS